jgi:hypothetical protein
MLLVEKFLAIRLFSNYYRETFLGSSDEKICSTSQMFTFTL